jgi:hypothetical protein
MLSIRKGQISARLRLRRDDAARPLGPRFRKERDARENAGAAISRRARLPVIFAGQAESPPKAVKHPAATLELRRKPNLE